MKFNNSLKGNEIHNKHMPVRKNKGALTVVDDDIKKHQCISQGPDHEEEEEEEQEGQGAITENSLLLSSMILRCLSLMVRRGTFMFFDDEREVKMKRMGCR